MSRPFLPSPPFDSPRRTDGEVGDPPTAEGPLHSADARPAGSRAAGRRPTGLRIALVGAVVAALWMAAGVAARPIQQTCDASLAHEVCAETIDAALRKGMPAIHPLLLAAHAEPGPAARPDQSGHRATVTFKLLGTPGPVAVRLFFDAGGHWGGIPDRQAIELAAWALGWAIAAGTVVAVAASGLQRVARRSRPAA